MRPVVAQKAQTQTAETGFYASLCPDIAESAEPFSERLSAVSSDVDFNREPHQVSNVRYNIHPGNQNPGLPRSLPYVVSKRLTLIRK